MKEHRIYYTDTDPESPFYGERFEFMRGLDITRAESITNEMNTGGLLCRRYVARVSDEIHLRNTGSLFYYHEHFNPCVGHLGDWMRKLSPAESRNSSHHDNKSNDEEAPNGALPSNREECGRPTDVPRHRAQIEEQPEAIRKVHVRSAGSRPVGEGIRGGESCPRGPDHKLSI